MSNDSFTHKAEFLDDSFTAHRAEFLAHLDDGTLCPCCGRFAKRYKRKLNSAQARFLVELMQLTVSRQTLGGGHTELGLAACSNVPGLWIHVDREMIQAANHHVARDFSVLRFFDLIEPRPGQDNSAKRTSGYWRITAKGKRFVLGQIRVPRHVFVFSNRREGMSDDSTHIREALGVDHFDFKELMSTTARSKDAGQDLNGTLMSVMRQAPFALGRSRGEHD